jgi:hypothetical protein
MLIRKVCFKGMFYLMPYDTGAQNWGFTEDILNRCLITPDRSESCKQAQNLLMHFVSSEDLASWWYGVDAGQIIMILDTCHSGAIPEKGVSSWTARRSRFRAVEL